MSIWDGDDDDIWNGGEEGNFGDDEGFDWGDYWGGGEDTWGDSSGDSGSVWGDILRGIGSYFGGSGDSNGNASALWGFASGAAGAYLNKEAVEEQGRQARKTTEYEAALADYYQQKGKSRKRVALDTYGQFSLMNRWAPNATAAPALDMPTKPTP